MSEKMKSICLVIRHDQYDHLQHMNINVSGFIRDIIDDRLSNNTVVLNVSVDTRLLYDKIVSSSPKGDIDIEPYFREALKKMLEKRIEDMKGVHESL
jgi:fructose-1,6-bisphosphatase